MRSRVLLPLILLAVSLGCREDVESPTAPDSPAALDAMATSSLSFSQVSAGYWHACGLTSDNRAYCWGWNQYGQVGDGTTIPRLAPVPVGGNLRFRRLSAGFSSTCGVSLDYRAYCWGTNQVGQLGDGTTTPHLTPGPVAGERRYSQVETSSEYACGLTRPGNRVYCWGMNHTGQLGDGTSGGQDTTANGIPYRTRPVAVVGGLTFRQVSAGYWHTCGVTTDDRVFCWGHNGFGQVGDSSTSLLRLKPTRVAGTRHYRQVDAGREHTCAVTTGDRALCWGYGREGQLGMGTRTSSRWPRAVSGGVSFERVTANGWLTCGETPRNRAYCWGNNASGELGDGTTINRFTPVAVIGGLLFSQVSAGGGHTCGRTPGGIAYCWGFGGNGALGSGTTENSSTPAPVADPMVALR